VPRGPQPPSLTGVGKPIKTFVAAERDLIQEPQSVSGDVVEADADLPLLDQMQQVLARVFAGQLLRRLLKMPGKRGHGVGIRSQGVGREVPQPHVFDHALTQCGHGRLLSVRGWSRSSQKLDF